MDTIRTIQDLLTCNGSAQSVTIELTSASRRLIAAAPELLDILQAIVSDEDLRIVSGRRVAALHNNLDGVGQKFDYMDDPIEPEWLDAARAAIAKAIS